MSVDPFFLDDSPLSGSGRTVVANLGCLQCSYNLRGVRAWGRCPECGFEVAGSRNPGVGLRRASGPALMAVTAGAAWLTIAAAGWVAALGVVPVLAWSGGLAVWLSAVVVDVVMISALARFSSGGLFAERPTLERPFQVWRAAVLAAVAVHAAFAAASLAGTVPTAPWSGVQWVAGLVAMPGLAAAGACRMAGSVCRAIRWQSSAAVFGSAATMMLAALACLPSIGVLHVATPMMNAWPVWPVAALLAAPAALLTVGALRGLAAGFSLARQLSEAELEAALAAEAPDAAASPAPAPVAPAPTVAPPPPQPIVRPISRSPVRQPVRDSSGLHRLPDDALPLRRARRYDDDSSSTHLALLPPDESAPSTDPARGASPATAASPAPATGPVSETRI